MLKLMSSIAALAGATLAAQASAAPAGPFAQLCAAGKPAVLARVSGFKSATGNVTVKLYRSGSRFLEKGGYVRKVEVPVTRTGPMDVCVPVPSSGRYAIAVRHEIRGKKSRGDGGGFSGNPKLSLIDVALKRKPDQDEVSFVVNGSTRVVPVVLKYIEGGSLRPVA